jgi:hypothetical protein
MVGAFSMASWHERRAGDGSHCIQSAHLHQQTLEIFQDVNFDVQVDRRCVEQSIAG